MSLRTWLSLHPRVTGAGKATVSALLAWALVHAVPGPWSAYPYYAPLGAVIASAVTLRASTQGAFQAIGAMAVGAVLARAVDLLPLPQFPSLGIVVLLGVLASGWRLLGSSGSWVTTSALFVLVIGHSDPVDYTLAYVGLTTVGALIAIGVNALIPALPLTPAQRALDRLQERTAEHLDALAAAIAADELPDDATLRTALDTADTATDQARDSARANWNARRYRTWRASLDRQSEALVQAARTAQDAHRALSAASTGVPGLAEGPAGPGRYPDDATGTALSTAAELVRSIDDGAPDPEAVERLSRAIAEAERAAMDPEPGAPDRRTPAVLVALATLLPHQSEQSEQA